MNDKRSHIIFMGWLMWLGIGGGILLYAGFNWWPLIGVTNGWICIGLGVLCEGLFIINIIYTIMSGGQELGQPDPGEWDTSQEPVAPPPTPARPTKVPKYREPRPVPTTQEPEISLFVEPLPEVNAGGKSYMQLRDEWNARNGWRLAPFQNFLDGTTNEETKPEE